MSKINIKIVEVHQDTHSVVVKYASENSKKNIDDYPGVAFQVSNFNVTTPEEFIEAIRPQISLYVWQRDLSENPPTPVNISGWAGYAVEVENYVPPVDPAAPTQVIPAQTNPEVTI
jgi:hypothetical protein